VLFEKYSGTEITYESEKYLIMHETDILAIQG
jgi:co-chaperonin GroES (HSP10)